MKIYSDTLTFTDLHAAKPMGVTIVDIETISEPRTVNPTTGKRYAMGWNIYLEGSSHHRSQHEGRGYAGNAATWDEWGMWMDELYRLDPEVKIGHYKSHEHFIQETTRVRDLYANENSLVARGHRAPWLNPRVMARPMESARDFASRS